MIPVIDGLQLITAAAGGGSSLERALEERNVSR
jgi:hypothetical protein